MPKMQLPKHIDVYKLTERGARFEGWVAQTEMTRLLTLVNAPMEDVSAVLNFGIDEQQVRYIEGQITAVLELVCQRCLQPFVYPVTSQLCLGVVKDDEAAAKLASNYEPLVVKNELIKLTDLIEDELILALPLVAIHEPSACSVKLISNKPEIVKASPFEVLKAGKKNIIDN